MFDWLKNFQNARLGDVTGGVFGPKPDANGWQTTMQAEGSPFVTSTTGAFAGFNPSISDIGKGLQGAAAQMPNGGAFAPSTQTSQSTQSPEGVPQNAPQGLYSRTPQGGAPGEPKPSWIQSLMLR